MSTKPLRELIIRKGNELVQAKRSTHLTSRERKLVSFMVAQISPWDNDFKEYCFPFAEFVDYFGITDKNALKEYEKIAHGIMGKPFLIDDRERQERFTCCWLAEAAYDKKERMFKYRFTPRLKPYLIQLKRYYTKYRMANLVNLDHVHSETMLELIKQYENLGECTRRLDDLRDYLGLGPAEAPGAKYPAYANLKDKVINPTLEEINKYTDIQVSLEEIKDGRKVVSLKFKITPQPNNPEVAAAKLRHHGAPDIAATEAELAPATQRAETASTQALAEQPAEMAPLLKSLVEEFEFTKEEGLSLCARYSAEQILGNLEVTRQRAVANRANNIETKLTAYARSAIQRDFRKDAKGQPRVEILAGPKTADPAAQSQRIRSYLDRMHQAWRKARINDVFEQRKDSFRPEFGRWLEARLEEPGMAETYEEFQLSGLENPRVRGLARIVLAEQEKLDQRFALSVFMQQEAYAVTTENGQEILFKVGRRMDV